MNKTILLFINLAVIIVKVSAQDELVFKIHYSPKMDYRQTGTTTSENKVEYIGSEDFLQKLTDNGVVNPIVSVEISSSETIWRTGKLDDTNLFPIEIEYVSQDRSDGKKFPPPGTKVYGHSTLNERFVIDSIPSTQLSDEDKQIIIQVSQSAFELFDIPEQRLKIGERYTQVTPLSIPVTETTLDMEIITTYTLMSIENNIAYFDIVQDYKMTSAIETLSIEASGSGSGKLNYDIHKHFYTDYVLDSTTIMNIDFGDFTGNLAQKSKTVSTVIISEQ